MNTTPLFSYSDELIIVMIQSRNENDFSDLYDAFAPLLYGIIMRIVADKQKAGLILHRTFVHIWLHTDEYDNRKQHFITWAMQVARRQSLGY